MRLKCMRHLRPGLPIHILLQAVFFLDQLQSINPEFMYIKVTPHQLRTHCKI